MKNKSSLFLLFIILSLSFISAGNRKSELRNQKSEIRTQKSELRTQKSEIRNLMLTSGKFYKQDNIDNNILSPQCYPSGYAGFSFLFLYGGEINV